MKSSYISGPALNRVQNDGWIASELVRAEHHQAQGRKMVRLWSLV